MEERKAKILVYDLEVTPTLGWTYGLWDTRVLKVEKNPHLMCFSYRWYGEKETAHFSLPDFDTYNVDPTNDYLILQELWKLLDAADVVIAHNAVNFDNRVANAYFIEKNIKPPSPFKTIDTYKVAKRVGRFGSASLNALGEQLGIGTKTKETHSDLWYDCLKGNSKEKEVAWRKMVKYCDQDVNLLHKLYERLRPYMATHPNIGRLTNSIDVCPKCGSDKIQHRGYRVTNLSKFRRGQCQNCGGWCSRRIAESVLDDIKPTYVNFSA